MNLNVTNVGHEFMPVKSIPELSLEYRLRKKVLSIFGQHFDFLEVCLFTIISAIVLTNELKCAGLLCYSPFVKHVAYFVNLSLMEL